MAGRNFGSMLWPKRSGYRASLCNLSAVQAVHPPFPAQRQATTKKNTKLPSAAVAGLETGLVSGVWWYK